MYGGELLQYHLGIAEDNTMTKCRWFLLCTHEAVGTMPHPILGDVPICDRCATKLFNEEERTAITPFGEWEYYSNGEFAEDLNKIQQLLGSARYEIQTLLGLNYIRRVED